MAWDKFWLDAAQSIYACMVTFSLNIWYQYKINIVLGRINSNYIEGDPVLRETCLNGDLKKSTPPESSVETVIKEDGLAVSNGRVRGEAISLQNSVSEEKKSDDDCGRFKKSLVIEYMYVA